jgi:hypothetical protein
MDQKIVLAFQGDVLDKILHSGDRNRIDPVRAQRLPNRSRGGPERLDRLPPRESAKQPHALKNRPCKTKT